MLVVRVRDLANPSLSRSINRFAARDFPRRPCFLPARRCGFQLSPERCDRDGSESWRSAGPGAGRVGAPRSRCA
jgi:hypothetical protein